MNQHDILIMNLNKVLMHNTLIKSVNNILFITQKSYMFGGVPAILKVNSKVACYKLFYRVSNLDRAHKSKDVLFNIKNKIKTYIPT